jgi:RHS repeat-associated protein
MIYDINNLPEMIYKLNGTQQTYANDVSGARVWKIANGSSTYYLNNASGQTELVQTGNNNNAHTFSIYGNDNIGQVKRSGTTLARYYYLKDHLGSVKMIVNSSGTVDSYNDYYPFGMQMGGRNQTASVDGRLKFTGKERDAAETGLDYFGARYYDSWRGQWLSLDPEAEKHPHLGPYNYVSNNPINAFGPDGRDDFFLTWMPHGEHVGHSAVAIQQRDSKGNFTGNVGILNISSVSQRAEQIRNIEIYLNSGIAFF